MHVGAKHHVARLDADALPAGEFFFRRHLSSVGRDGESEPSPSSQFAQHPRAISASRDQSTFHGFDFDL
jgi:hypothetical protein